MDKDTRYIRSLNFEQELIPKPPCQLDTSVHLVCFHLVHPFVHPDNPFANLWNFCTWRETRFQQDHPPALRYRSPQGMGFSLRSGFTFPRHIPLHLPMGWWPFRPLVNGVYVSTQFHHIPQDQTFNNVKLYRICFQLIMVILYPTVIQPFFNKLSPLAEGELRTRIENLSSKLKFPLKHLYEIDGSKRSSHSNAYFFGLPWVSQIIINDLKELYYSSPSIE